MSTSRTRSTTAPDRDPATRLLDDSDVLRAWVPASFGGGPSTVPDVVARLTALGKSDTDLGWVGAVAAVTNLAVAEFPVETLQEIWGSGRPSLVAGTLAPQGTGEWVGGDFRVDAVSSPASGLPWADWVMSTVRDVDSGALVRVLVPVEDVRTEETWHAAGLQGTGSNTAHLAGVVVPLRRTRRLVPDPATAPLTFFATLFFAAPLIGTVAGALDRLLGEHDGGGPRWERADVRAALSSAALLTARATALSAGSTAALGTRAAVDALSPLARATAAELAVQALAAAERALPLLVSASGASALDADHPLARAVRDVGVGARHTALSPTKAVLAHIDALSVRPH